MNTQTDSCKKRFRRPNRKPANIRTFASPADQQLSTNPRTFPVVGKQKFLIARWTNTRKTWSIPRIDVATRTGTRGERHEERGTRTERHRSVSCHHPVSLVLGVVLCRRHNARNPCYCISRKENGYWRLWINEMVCYSGSFHCLTASYGCQGRWHRPHPLFRLRTGTTRH